MSKCRESEPKVGDDFLSAAISALVHRSAPFFSCALSLSLLLLLLLIDFADGNLKLILGFLWSLFRRFRIQTIKQDGERVSE